MTTVRAARINLWIEDLDWNEAIVVHDGHLISRIKELITAARGPEFVKCLHFTVVRAPSDLISLRGYKFGLTAWPESLDEFPPFVISEFCALKERADARKSR